MSKNLAPFNLPKPPNHKKNLQKNFLLTSLLPTESNPSFYPPIPSFINPMLILLFKRCPMVFFHKEPHSINMPSCIRRIKNSWVWGQTPNNPGSMMHIFICIVFIPQAQHQRRKRPNRIMYGNTYIWSYYLSSMTQDTLWSLFWTSKCLIQRGFPNGDQEHHAPCP